MKTRFTFPAFLLILSFILVSCGDSGTTSSDQSEDSETTEESSGISYGEFKDSRDGNTYRTLEIGGKTWMVDNLNFESEGSSCFGEDPEACKRDGRLYTFDAAVAAAPDGWHLATDDEWKALEKAAGMSDEDVEKTGLMRGKEINKELQAGGKTGFDVKLGGTWGYANGEVSWDNGGEIVSFWTATTVGDGMFDKYKAFDRTFYGDSNIARAESNKKLATVNPMKFARYVKD